MHYVILSAGLLSVSLALLLSSKQRLELKEELKPYREAIRLCEAVPPRDETCELVAINKGVELDETY